MSHDIPDHAWQKVGIDLLTHESTDYVVIVDYFSNFWEIDKLHHTTSNSVITKVKSHFARYGIPSTVMTDNGPQFACVEFRRFADTYDFEHITASPHYPQSNGKVESAVKSAKHMLKKTSKAGSDQYLALLDIRNTPTADLPSPAQRMFNRRTRTLLPTTSHLLQPRMNGDVRVAMRQSKQRQATYYNRGAKDLPPLEQGDVVRMKPFSMSARATWQKGVIAKRLDNRSYQIDSGNGSYRRNRVHLRKTKESDPTSESFVVGNSPQATSTPPVAPVRAPSTPVMSDEPVCSPITMRTSQRSNKGKPPEKLNL